MAPPNRPIWGRPTAQEPKRFGVFADYRVAYVVFTVYSLFAVHRLSNRCVHVLQARGFAIGGASDLRFTGRGFESWLNTIT